MATSVLLQSLGNGTIQDNQGNALSGHLVFVYQRGTNTQVQVYSNSALTTPLTQPLTSGTSGASPGGIPGYIAGEQAIDFFDQTANKTQPAEPLVVNDLIGTDGKIAGPRSVGITSSVVSASSGCAPATGVAATDYANLVAAIAATPVGGRCYIRGHYKINAALVINKAMTLEGDGVTAIYSAGGDASMPTGLNGTYIEQTVAATDGIDITASGAPVHLRGFGVLFTSGLASTGHGINATTTTLYGGQPDFGPMSYTWENVEVYGHDGNHYGFVRTNTLYGTTKHLRAYGGGGFLTVCNHTGTNTGNETDTHPYNCLNYVGTAHGFAQSSANSGGNNGVLNLLTRIRPQCEMGPLAQANGQNTWHDKVGAGVPQHVYAISPDLENGTSTIGAGTEFWGGLTTGTGSRPNSDVGFGFGVFGANPSATNMTAVGYQALGAATTGGSHTAVGFQALQAVTGSGANNTALGAQAGTAITTGSGHTLVGYQAGSTILTGGYSTFVGYQAGASTTGVGQAVAVGATASVTNQATALGYGTTASGSGSVALGCDHTNTGVSTSVQDQIALGTANHHTLWKTATDPGATALAASQFTLWLDPTNGACKLMIRAKQADGTSRTASVALA